MRDWPHGPAHYITDAGAYMVTAATYQKKPIFNTAERLTLLCDRLLELAEETGWNLQAWAVFPNHYHFVAESLKKDAVRALAQRLHAETGRIANELDETHGRQVWFQYWETHLTYPRSFFARLSYVHQNAVRHGVVRVAARYPWCSAGWLERRAERSFYRRIMEFSCERLKVPDDFDVDPKILSDGPP